ncbi:1-deoxy-D-xylulose-5-phosphate synthase [Porticoccus sp. Uisw_050_02]|uniref:1-deoxy-D-xylulose-5-phosphate synthase n=1 Tax=Porticoccus sp. Uisw_050_02 TaxID=3230978 RepID=UPI0039E8B979
MAQTFNNIPLIRPVTPLLDSINDPSDLRGLTSEQLLILADELRGYLLFSVGHSGGHFGAGLGTIELTIALHYVFNTPDDKLVWDVGHQAYPHKILTGRREEILSVRKAKGLSPFPNREESTYDAFGAGHSSTSISAALGMALAFKLNSDTKKTVAIIGDGAMTAGMAFEALNHTAHTDADLLVILNDNNMSISHNVGGLATYFSKIWSSRFYNTIREGGKKVLRAVPAASAFVKKTEVHLKAMVAPGIVFEELGFNYIGPIDGHDVPLLIKTLSNLKALSSPILLHTITQKGKGFGPAESDPVGYHALNKIEPNVTAPEEKISTKPPKKKYQQIFGDWLCDMAAEDPLLIAITPAMCEGSGMVEFSQRYPDRFHDVAIAEQHAITLAAGLACENTKPVVAIYSTFLQRAYDQLVHDVALQNLNVLFAIDRAGLVGEDGASHAGSFDITFLRCIPNLIIMTPSNENETRQMLYTGFSHNGPAAVRYPRGTGPGIEIIQKMTALTIGKGKIVREGKRLAILNFGALLETARLVGEELNATVADMRFVKPLDAALIEKLSSENILLVTVEDNAVFGGAGSAVSECLACLGLATHVLHLGLPDKFITHGSREYQLDLAGLDQLSMKLSIQTKLKALN